MQTAWPLPTRIASFVLIFLKVQLLVDCVIFNKNIFLPLVIFIMCKFLALHPIYPV